MVRLWGYMADQQERLAKKTELLLLKCLTRLSFRTFSGKFKYLHSSSFLRPAGSELKIETCYDLATVKCTALQSPIYLHYVKSLNGYNLRNELYMFRF